MIDPLSKAVLQQERISLPVLVTVGAIHIALLWMMLQAVPSLQVTHTVVYQMLLSPITQLKERLPTPAVQAPREVQEIRDMEAPVSTTNAIQTHKPVERPADKPQKIVEVVPVVKPVQVALESIPVSPPPPPLPPPPVPLPCRYRPPRQRQHRHRHPLRCLLLVLVLVLVLVHLPRQRQRQRLLLLLHLHLHPLPLPLPRLSLHGPWPSPRWKNHLLLLPLPPPRLAATFRRAGGLQLQAAPAALASLTRTT